MSQPQPEPNCFAVVSLNCFLKSSKLAKIFFDLFADGARGIAAAFRLHDGPEHAVVDVAAAVVADDGANVFRHAVQIAQQVFSRVFAEVGMLLDGAVERGDVGLVVLVVMQVHRLGVDVRLERGVIVGKRWNFVCQSNPPCGM